MGGSEQLVLNLQYQRNPKADDVSALIAVVRPILLGTLFALKREIVRQVGGYDRVTLELLARLYEPGDGDCGLCFEYAVHDALTRAEPTVTERVADGLKLCNVPGAAQSSILFAAEKSGVIQLIDTARERLTDDSRLMYGSRGQPVKLMKHIDAVATAFRRPEARLALPQSIGGLWKADLIVGCTDTDKWVGTTVKINPTDLEGARGLRIGIVPARERASDAIRRDQARNLVVCPVPYDGAFMEMFYRGWGIVQQVISAHGRVPREVNLPQPSERQVARELAGRRSYPVTEVVDALGPVAQPHLIDTQQHGADVVTRRSAPAPQTNLVVAPMPAMRTCGRGQAVPDPW
jgi:hypothetical protein